MEVFGPKGSLLATNDQLLYRPAKSPAGPESLEGAPVKLGAVLPETSSPIAYFTYCIWNDKPIEDPVSARLNVAVNEILDAAKESASSGRAVSLAAR